MFTKPEESSMLIELGNFRADFQPWRPTCGRVFTTRFAFDSETTPIVGHEPPDYVLGAATDGSRGVFLTPDVVGDFLVVHEGAEVIMHRCAFDLAVLHKLFEVQGRSLDVYGLVDEHKLRDCLTLHKLHGLVPAVVGGGRPAPGVPGSRGLERERDAVAQRPLPSTYL
jgi:hypothetical protein